MALLGCVRAAAEHHESFLSGEMGWKENEKDALLTC